MPEVYLLILLFLIFIICIAVLARLLCCCKRNPNEIKEDVEKGQTEPFLLSIYENEEKSGEDNSVEELIFENLLVDKKVEEVQPVENFIQQPSPLLEELIYYYDTHVKIPAPKQNRASEVVDKIKSNLQLFMEDSETFVFGDIMCQGSSYEGLKVIKPNEFDLLLPLILKNSEWRYNKVENGYVFIKKLQRSHDTMTPYDKVIVNYVYLSPIDIRRNMQSILHKVLEKIRRSCNVHVTLRENGPALTLQVRYDNSCEMSIDIVPSISMRGKLFVAKRHPESDLYQCRTDDNKYNNLWRVSFSKEEKLIIKEMDENDECLQALKILKTIRVRKGKSSPLNKLSSYHLKTCMLHLNADRSIESRHQDKLDNCFKDLLRKLIEFLEDEKMPSFHDHHPIHQLSRSTEPKLLEVLAL
ncbi:mitochondrial dynamics protein MID51-like [Anneissia japonica]|uniref:mitochondrial dynamics protein MID51-like n=1 Tax=Anneissia japonica TaxID=1529436 RepID=UPI0014259D73|nr:mitochondrial dynamics protein MID51-like [Anneissia japonica]